MGLRVEVFLGCTFIGDLTTRVKLFEFSALEGIVILVVADAESETEMLIFVNVHFTPIPCVHVDDFGPMAGIKWEQIGPLTTQEALAAWCQAVGSPRSYIFE